MRLLIVRWVLLAKHCTYVLYLVVLNSPAPIHCAFSKLKLVVLSVTFQSKVHRHLLQTNRKTCLKLPTTTAPLQRTLVISFACRTFQCTHGGKLEFANVSLNKAHHPSTLAGESLLNPAPRLRPVTNTKYHWNFQICKKFMSYGNTTVHNIFQWLRWFVISCVFVFVSIYRNYLPQKNAFDVRRMRLCSIEKVTSNRRM